MKMHVHEDEQQAQAVAAGQLQSVEGKPWMVAIWVEEEDKLVLHRTTWKFPSSKMTEARELLRENMAEEICPRIEPLPLADFIARAIGASACCEGVEYDETV